MKRLTILVPFAAISRARHSASIYSIRFPVLGQNIAMALCALGLGLSFTDPIGATENSCGPLSIPGKFGPYDYRTHDRALLADVDRSHFPPNVEALIKPKWSSFGADIAYTLWAYPNHHRALLTLIRLGEKEKTDHPRQMAYPIDCWFERAIRFRNDDLVVKLIYSRYLRGVSRLDEARTQLDIVAKQAGDNPLTHFNVGLGYFELKDFDAAVRHAKLALEGGYPRTELKEMLEQAGRWPSPAPTASEPARTGATS